MRESTSRPRLLFVLPIIPWPVRRSGISLRFAPVIEYLAQRYELDILVLAEDEEALPSGCSPERCPTLAVIRMPHTSLPRWIRKMRVAWYWLVPWGPPVGSLKYANSSLERALLRYLQQKDYAAVIWAAGQLDVACRVRRRNPRTRFVMDLVDSPALFSFRNASTNLAVRMLTRYDGWKSLRLERRVRQAFDATIYISNIDAQVVRADPAAQVHVIPNGIFCADAPPLAEAVPGAVIGFLGHMGYPPNVSAAVRLAQRIFPRIQARLAAASLLIIGREPAPEVTQLAAPRISVTGTVDNIWPYIARANVFVFPMVEGTGLQNKILEAMYAGIPVVTTSIAADGLGARSGEQLLIGDTDDEIVHQTVKLLGDARYGAQLAQRARAFVLREFSWPAILPRYEAIVAPRVMEREERGLARPKRVPQDKASYVERR
jgi:polysaccharide biosynthesis protein PslH